MFCDIIQFIVSDNFGQSVYMYQNKHQETQTLSTSEKSDDLSAHEATVCLGAIY